MTNPWGQSGPEQPGTPQSGWQPAAQPYPPPPAAQYPPSPQQQYAPPGQQYAPPAAQPPSPSSTGDASPRSNSRFFLGLAAGIAIPVIVGLVLLLTGVMQFGGNSDDAAAMDTTPVTMPDTLGGLRTAGQVVTDKGGERANETVQRYERTAALTTEAYTTAFGGAGSGAQVYADDDFETSVTAIAVRGPSPRMTNGPVNDPEDLGLAAMPQTVEQFGEVDCLILTIQTVAAGTEVDPENQRAATCQRTGPNGTAVVTGNGGDGPEGRATMIALAEATYALLATTE